MVFSGGLEEGFGAGAGGMGTAGIGDADGAFEIQGWENTDFGANGPLDYIKIYKKPIGAGIVGLVIIGILASSMGGDSEPTPAPAPPAPAPLAVPPPPPPPPPAPHRHKAPPSPEAVSAANRIHLEVNAGLADGVISEAQPLAIYTFSAEIGQTYLIETELPAHSVMDSTLSLYDMDGTTPIDYNDDDTRSANVRDSFMEWTCPVSGTYFLEVACNCEPSVDPMTFQISVTTSAQNNPCDTSTPGAMMEETSATIVFQPDGDYEDEQICTWTVTCASGLLPVFTFEQLETEGGFDFVSLYDGSLEGNMIAHLSGEPTDLASTPYAATGSTMVMRFTSDTSIGAGGFSVHYQCDASTTVDPLPPPPPAVTPPPPPAPPACDAHPCVHGTGGEDYHGCTNLGGAPMCFDTCLTHGDGECDDGGLDSEYNVCALGTDCADCGPRTGFTCNCEDGYEGLTCATLSDPCSVLDCVNGGVCETQCFLGLCAASCSCPYGFE
eukprot:COSAG06_NODE_7821_length_2363_cov_15.210247_3_plen_494_part_01